MYHDLRELLSCDDIDAVLASLVPGIDRSTEDPLPEAPLLRGVRSVVIAHDLLPLRYPRPTPLLAYHLARRKPLSFAWSINDYGIELLSSKPAPLEEALADRYRHGDGDHNERGENAADKGGYGRDG